MSKIIIDENYCKGCELCVEACPKNLIALEREKMNGKGYHPAGVKDMELCVGCASCANMCPDCAITVIKE